MPASSLSSLSSTNAGFWWEWRKIANFYPPSAGKSRSRGPSNRNRNRSSHTGDDLRRPYPNLIGGGEGEGLGGKFHVQHGRPRLLSSFVASKYYFAVRTIKKRKERKEEKRSVELNAQSPFDLPFVESTTHPIRTRIVCPPNYASIFK